MSTPQSAHEKIVQQISDSPLVRSIPNPRIALFELASVLDQIEPLRIKMGVSHDNLADVLGVSTKTYNTHKRNLFLTLKVHQIQKLFDFFLSCENIVVNQRIQNHARNSPKLREYYYE
jgi:DNA-binding XRE family transcriptional regulator